MKKIDDLLYGIRSVAIAGHIRPDGDCAGSVLALYNYLKNNYPQLQADAYLEQPSQRFSFLRGFEEIISLENIHPDTTYDLMICLDCSTPERLGKAEAFLNHASRTICIDHHISNEGYADENYIVPDASSACEVLYGFLDPEKLDLDIAICLYEGIVSDTGVFKYSSTSPDTMRIAADLMAYGIDTNQVIDEGFSAKGYNETRILGYALEHSNLAFDGQVIYSGITDEIMKEYGVTTKELDGIVAELRQVRGVVCAVFLYQTGHHEYKVSFRSNAPFDVNRLAGGFGGGGHVRAAGCNVTGELDTCLEAILLHISVQLGEMEP